MWALTWSTARQLLFSLGPSNWTSICSGIVVWKCMATRSKTYLFAIHSGCAFAHNAHHPVRVPSFPSSDPPSLTLLGQDRIAPGGCENVALCFRKLPLFSDANSMGAYRLKEVWEASLPWAGSKMQKLNMKSKIEGIQQGDTKSTWIILQMLHLFTFPVSCYWYAKCILA